MLKLTPILLALIYGFAMYRFSAWQTARRLDAESTELSDPMLGQLGDQMAAALDLPRIRVHIYEIEQINGLAAPDGRIFITRGFYKKFQNGEVSADGDGVDDGHAPCPSHDHCHSPCLSPSGSTLVMVVVMLMFVQGRVKCRHHDGF